MPEDIQILSDTTTDGVRHITAVPSALVCSRQIDFDLVDGTVRNLRYIGGCHGNLQALGALLEGQPVDFALSRLTGINCKERGTSCSDQLTRVLRAVL
ncbi:MAG: TIGR03905 family TSCPD domain-containing protein [Bacteroidales bacterium]|nr:TIGR03905 family TSCPD domain-containing protein [Bacteroidales bacterium]